MTAKGQAESEEKAKQVSPDSRLMFWLMLQAALEAVVCNYAQLLVHNIDPAGESPRRAAPTRSSESPRSSGRNNKDQGHG